MPYSLTGSNSLVKPQAIIQIGLTDPNVDKTKFIMVIGLNLQVANNIYVPDSIPAHITIRIMPSVGETEVPRQANNVLPIVISPRRYSKNILRIPKKVFNL